MSGARVHRRRSGARPRLRWSRT